MKPEELASAIIEHGAAYLRHNARINRDAFEGVDIDAAIDLARQALAAQPAPTTEPEGFGDREPTDTERELFQCLDAFVSEQTREIGLQQLLTDGTFVAARAFDKFEHYYDIEARRTGPAELAVTLCADFLGAQVPMTDFEFPLDPVHERFTVVVDAGREAARCTGWGRIGRRSRAHNWAHGSGDATAALCELLRDARKDTHRTSGYEDAAGLSPPLEGNERAQFLLETALDLQREASALLWPVDDEPTPF
jgi:hypothetical protein